MRDPEEEDLDAMMARLAEGDRSAFDGLFAALYPRAERVASRRLGPSLAADAAQAALLRVFARAAEFVPGRPVLPWFYAIVANEVRAHERREGLGRPHVLPADLGPDRDDGPEQVLLERELHRALAQAIARLDGPSADAIRVLLGEEPQPAIDPATFRKRVSRAYARLRLLLGGSYGR